MTVLLAHAGAGAQWQALVVAIGVLTAILFLLVVSKVVKVKDHNDLVLPLAGVVIISSLATSQSETLSDQVGWALPLGVVALGGLVWASMKPEEFTWKAPPTMIVVGLAAVLGVVLQAPLTQALHPPVEVFDVTALPVVDDARLTIVSPEDRSTVGTVVTIEVELAGGTIANQVMSADDAPEDPEELGNVRLLLGATPLDVLPQEVCSAESPCTKLTYLVELEPGTHTLLAEFRTATGSGFRTSVFDAIIITVE